METDHWQVVPISERLKQEDVSKIANRNYELIKHNEVIQDLVGEVAAPASHKHSHSTLASFHPSLGSEGSSMNMQLSGTATRDDDPSQDGVADLLTLQPSLEAALRLNMVLQRRLQDRLAALEKSLQRNVQRQQEINNQMSEADDECEGRASKPSLRISQFAVPYFKNGSGMNAPKNHDAKTKIEKGYMDLYTSRSRTWILSEKKKLTIGVHLEWKEQFIEEEQTVLRSMHREFKNVSKPEVRERLNIEIKRKEGEIALYKSSPAKEFIPPPRKKMDWEKIAAQTFNGYRNGEECQLLWENLLHPSINTRGWTEHEDRAIQKMVTKCGNKKPKWEKIAKTLKTGRTAYLVAQRWMSFLRPTLNPMRWTTANTKTLIEAVTELRAGDFIPWAQVGHRLAGFTRSQIQSRWAHVNPAITFAHFTAAEDSNMILGLHVFGYNFSRIAHFLTGRTATQIRRRYRTTLLPGFTNNPWSQIEDDTLVRLCSKKNFNWQDIVNEMPGRSLCQLQVRYQTLVVWNKVLANDTRPPIMFPLSTTEDPDLIHELRLKLSHNAAGIRTFLAQLKEQNEETPNEEMMKNLMEGKQHRRTVAAMPKRCGNVSRPKKELEEDQLLTEFFLPGRKYPGITPIPDSRVQANLLALSRIMQLKIPSPVSDAEVEMLESVGLTGDDRRVVDQLACGHHTQPPCKACDEGVNPDAIPLLPPNMTTVGAIGSFLMHKPRLSAMADGTFHQALDQAVMDESPKKKRKHIKVEAGDSQDDPGEAVTVPGSPTLHPAHHFAPQLHITTWKRTASGAMKKCLKPLPMSIKKEVSSDGSTEGGCATTEADERVDTKRVLDPEWKEADQLLFRRMLSIFCWPGLLINRSPPLDHVLDAKEKVMKTKKKRGRPAKKHNPFTHIGIEETEELIEQLEHGSIDEAGRNDGGRPGSGSPRPHTPHPPHRPPPGESSTTQRYSADGDRGGGPDTLSPAKPPPFHHKQHTKRAKTIKKLKRSLVAKKVWERRRQGQSEKRPSRSRTLQYQARPSRTRGASQDAAQDATHDASMETQDATHDASKETQDVTQDATHDASKETQDGTQDANQKNTKDATQETTQETTKATTQYTTQETTQEITQETTLILHPVQYPAKDLSSQLDLA